MYGIFDKGIRVKIIQGFSYVEVKGSGGVERLVRRYHSGHVVICRNWAEFNNFRDLAISRGGLVQVLTHIKSI